MMIKCTYTRLIRRFYIIAAALLYLTITACTAPMTDSGASVKMEYEDTDFEKDLFKEVYNEIISKHNAPEIYTDILNYIIIEAKL